VAARLAILYDSCRLRRRGRRIAARLVYKSVWERVDEVEGEIGLGPLKAEGVRMLVQPQERMTSSRALRKVAIVSVGGAFDRAGYDLARDSAQADLEAAQAEIDRIQPAAPTVALPPVDDVLRKLGGWSLVLQGGDIAAKRDVLGLLIERATPVRIGFGKYDVQIEWTALGKGLRHLVGAVGANV
jgi:hypothetical protein